MLQQLLHLAPRHEQYGIEESHCCQWGPHPLEEASYALLCQRLHNAPSSLLARTFRASDNAEGGVAYLSCCIERAIVQRGFAGCRLWLTLELNLQSSW